jgi:hypothetical protein
MEATEKAAEEKAFEESWVKSVGNLRKAIAPKDDLNKAGDGAPPKEKGKEKDEESEEEEDDDEKEEGEEPEPEMGKSMEDIVEEDPEAQAAMDVEPFLRQFVKAFDIVMAGTLTEVKRMRKSMKANKTLTKALADVLVKSAELQKSMSDTMGKIGSTPMPMHSRLSVAGGEKFSKGKDSKEWSRNELLAKSMELVKAGTLDTKDASLLELKLNRNTFDPVNDPFSKAIVERFESALSK